MRAAKIGRGSFMAAFFSGKLEGEFEFAAQFLAIGQVELVFLDEELAVHLVGGVFDKQFVLVPGENDADGRIVARDIFFLGEVAEVKIHLANVVVLDFVQFQINQNEAAQDAMVEHEVHPVMGVVDGDAVLPPDEGEAFAKLQEEGLEVIAKKSF